MDLIQNIDVSLNNYFVIVASRYETFTDSVNIFSNIVVPYSIAIISIFVVAYFIKKEQWRSVSLVSISLLGGIVIGKVVKNIVMRLRPEQADALGMGYSFPSNHAIAGTIFSLLVVYFLADKIKSKILRILILLFVLLFAAFISYSRIYLGVHWLSDVIAGIGIGTIWMILVMSLTKAIPNR